MASYDTASFTLVRRRLRTQLGDTSYDQPQRLSANRHRRRFRLAARESGRAGFGVATQTTEALPLYKVVYDVRFPQSVSFAQRAQQLGVATHAIEGDMTSFWYDDLYHRWRQDPVAIAGLTAHGPMFCFEQLAMDQRMRVVFRAAASNRCGGLCGARVHGSGRYAGRCTRCNRPQRLGRAHGGARHPVPQRPHRDRLSYRPHRVARCRTRIAVFVGDCARRSRLGDATGRADTESKHQGRASASRRPSLDECAGVVAARRPRCGVRTLGVRPGARRSSAANKCFRIGALRVTHRGLDIRGRRRSTSSIKESSLGLSRNGPISCLLSHRHSFVPAYR